MNFLIQNGMIYNPAVQTFQKGELAMADGRIVPAETITNCRQVIDAEG